MLSELPGMYLLFVGAHDVHKRATQGDVGAQHAASSKDLLKGLHNSNIHAGLGRLAIMQAMYINRAKAAV